MGRVSWPWQALAKGLRIEFEWYGIVCLGTCRADTIVRVRAQDRMVVCMYDQQSVDVRDDIDMHMLMIQAIRVLRKSFNVTLGQRYLV